MCTTITFNCARRHTSPIRVGWLFCGTTWLDIRCPTTVKHSSLVCCMGRTETPSKGDKAATAASHAMEQSVNLKLVSSSDDRVLAIRDHLVRRVRDNGSLEVQRDSVRLIS